MANARELPSVNATVPALVQSSSQPATQSATQSVSQPATHPTRPTNTTPIIQCVTGYETERREIQTAGSDEGSEAHS